MRWLFWRRIIKVTDESLRIATKPRKGSNLKLNIMEYQKYFTNYEDYKKSSSLYRTIYSLRDVSPLQAKLLVKYNMVNVISNGRDGYYLEPTGKFTYLSNMYGG